MHDIIIKQIDKIRPVNTSHNIGSKKILVSKKEIVNVIYFSIPEHDFS